MSVAAWLALYFGWPAGAVWGNVIAEPVIFLASAAVVWLLRDRIGRHLAAWWHKHHGPHAIAEHRQALAEHEASKGSR